uniref:HMA domain-containing protein n=1 Tax=Fagus sylvatica TaxID=28930 RepID=A0A2N9HJF4_FAGSY
MAKLVEEAQCSKSKTQRVIDKCAKFYTPAVIIISTGIAVIPLALKLHNRNHWFHLALVVLVSACPCPLILSTPVATFCAPYKGSHIWSSNQRGICVFEQLTLRTNRERMRQDLCIRAVNIEDKQGTRVSSIESKSSHPMAAALVDHARSLAIEPKPENVSEFQSFPGEGIHGNIDGNDIYIGNRKIALRAGCGTVPTLEGDVEGGKTIGYIYSGATPAGIFSLSDACRSGVQDAIRELKLLGIKTAMLTGDSHAAATHVQEQGK